MFRTLLLATVVGSVNGATTPAKDLNERGNSPPSYFCSSSQNKCAAAKQQGSLSAYCSTFLAVPRVTKTQTGYTCKTATSTVTSFTRTVTKTAPVATTTVKPISTITSCAAPANTVVADPNDKRNAAVKPSCLPSEKQSVSMACSCLSLRPSTVTTTITNTDLKRATTTVKACTTITQSASTTSTVTEPGATSYAVPTSFYIQNDRGYYAINPLDFKEIQDVSFDESSDLEILFQLNSAGHLIHENGKLLVESPPAKAKTERYSIEVNTAPQSDVDDGSVLPLTCSVSYSAEDGTCPLKCQVEAGDVNQGVHAGDWFLGPPGFATNTTFNTFAVVRGTPSGRGGTGRRNRSRR